MSEDSSVNGRIVDSVASVVTLMTGQAPAQSIGMLDAVLLETLGMAMHNAVNRQQGASMVGSAAVTAACSKMLSTPFLIELPPPPLPPPPAVNLLPSPNPPSASAVIAAAFAEGETAIKALRAQAQGTSADAAQAQADLAQLAKDAATPQGGG